MHGSVPATPWLNHAVEGHATQEGRPSIMSDIILIGGPSRVGKTTLASRMREEFEQDDKSVAVFHMDMLARAMRRALGVGGDLHDVDWKTPGTFATKAHRRDTVVWSVAEGLVGEVASSPESPDVIIVEGNIWPDLTNPMEPVAGTDVRPVAVWMYRTGDPEDEHGLLLHINATDPSGSWLANRSEESLADYARTNLARSEWYARLASSQGTRDGETYVDTSRHGSLDEAHDAAMAFVRETVLRRASDEVA